MGRWYSGPQKIVNLSKWLRSRSRSGRMIRGAGNTPWDQKGDSYQGRGAEDLDWFRPRRKWSLIGHSTWVGSGSSLTRT